MENNSRIRLMNLLGQIEDHCRQTGYCCGNIIPNNEKEGSDFVGMEQRLESLATILRDAANEAEECCRLQKETTHGLYSTVIEMKLKNKFLHSQINKMLLKEVKYKAAIQQEKERSNILKQRLDKSLSEHKLYWRLTFKDIILQKGILLRNLKNLLINVLNAIQNDVSLPQSVQIYLQCCKKEVSSMTIENLLEMYLLESRAKSKWDAQRFQPFVKECIKICWLCAIRNPPMHFMFEKNIRGKRFHTDVYKPYSQSGEYVDFLVLPALYLHENGPLLAKGIAQGAKKSTPLKLRLSPNKPSKRIGSGHGPRCDAAYICGRQTKDTFSKYLWKYHENEFKTGRRSRSIERTNYFERNKSRSAKRSKSASNISR